MAVTFEIVDDGAFFRRQMMAVEEDIDLVIAELATGEIADLTTGQRFRAEPFPPFMMELIAAGGLAAYLKGERK